MSQPLKGFYNLLNHAEYGLTAVNIFDKPSGLQDKFYISTQEEYIEIVERYNGKGQIYQSVNPVRQDIDKSTWHTNADIQFVTNIFIDCDAKKESGSIPEKELKNYAATDEEYAASWNSLEIIDSWLRSKGLKTGYSDKTGNGTRKLLPIPTIEITESNRDVIPLKIKAFLDEIRKDTGLSLDGVQDLRRITGVPTTLNKKLETDTRKNRIREPMNPIPARDEDSRLKDYILQLDHNKTEQKKEEDKPKSGVNIDFWLAKDPKLNKLYSGNIEGYASRSEAELALYQKLIYYRYNDTEIDLLMSSSKIGKWKSAKPTYTERTKLKARKNQNVFTDDSQPPTEEKEAISEDEYNESINEIINNKFILNIPKNHFISRYVEWANTTTDAFEEYHIAAALWLLSASVEGKTYIPLASGRIYPNLWIDMKGESTISRKTIAANKAKKIYETVKDEVLLNPDFSRDGLLRELSQTPVMASIRDESSALLAKMHQKYNDGIFPLECQLYDRQHVKKSLAKEEDSITVINPYITRLYATAPTTYIRIMKIEDFECGWGYRWLHIHPKYKRDRRPQRLENDYDIDLWTTILGKAKKQFNFFNNRAEFPMGISDSAMKLYQDITMGLENYAVEKNNSYFNGMIGRGNDYIMKVAILYELGKNEIGLEIQVDSIIFATRFVIYSLECEFNLINDLLENIEFNKVEKVLHAIKKSNGSITHSKLLQNVRLYKEDIAKCIESLVDAELIEVVKVETNKGKSTTHYKLLVNEDEKINFKNIFKDSDTSGFKNIFSSDLIDLVKLDRLDRLDRLQTYEKGNIGMSNLSNSINLNSIDKNSGLYTARQYDDILYEPSNLSNSSNSTNSDTLREKIVTYYSNIWSGNNGPVNSTNIVKFYMDCAGHCKLSTGEIKPMAEKLFKLAPKANNEDQEINIATPDMTPEQTLETLKGCGYNE